MTCPICKSAPNATYRPFCSKRCADLDLGRWLTGAYTVETEELPEDVPLRDQGEETRH